jgi:hypothetical protein
MERLQAGGWTMPCKEAEIDALRLLMFRLTHPAPVSDGHCMRIADLYAYGVS